MTDHKHSQSAFLANPFHLEYASGVNVVAELWNSLLDLLTMVRARQLVVDNPDHVSHDRVPDLDISVCGVVVDVFD